jgi:hypothetical protein
MDNAVNRSFLPTIMCAALLSCAQTAEAQSYRLDRVTVGNVQEQFPSTNPVPWAQPVSEQQSSQYVVRTAPQVSNEQPKISPEVIQLGRALVGSFASSVAPRASRQAAPVAYNGFRQTSTLTGATALFTVPTASQLKRITSRDVVIIIDKSRSMSEPDCPGGDTPPILSRFLPGGQMREAGGIGITRWEWCRRQAMHVASQLSRLPGSNLKLVLFDDRVTEFDNVSMEAVSDIFNRYKPSGGTNATKALKTAIQEYFERRNHFGRARPLSVVVITDGAPSSPRSLKDLLIETSLKLNEPSEMQFSFLQIGRDHQGNQLLPELDLGLVAEGAKYDIVSSRGFNSVSRTGLMTALLDTAR